MQASPSEGVSILDPEDEAAEYPVIALHLKPDDVGQRGNQEKDTSIGPEGTSLPWGHRFTHSNVQASRVSKEIARPRDAPQLLEGGFGANPLLHRVAPPRHLP